MRPLRADERALLEHLLRVDMPGIEELRAQVDRAEVDEKASQQFDLVLRVPHDAASAKRVLNDHPIRCLSKDENLDIALEMDGYYLGGIYVAWYEREPSRLPWREELQAAFRSVTAG